MGEFQYFLLSMHYAYRIFLCFYLQDLEAREKALIDQVQDNGLHQINQVCSCLKIRDGNPAKKSADSDSGFYCIFFALRIRIPILIT